MYVLLRVDTTSNLLRLNPFNLRHVSTSREKKEKETLLVDAYLMRDLFLDIQLPHILALKEFASLGRPIMTLFLAGLQ